MPKLTLMEEVLLLGLKDKQVCLALQCWGCGLYAAEEGDDQLRGEGWGTSTTLEVRALKVRVSRPARGRRKGRSAICFLLSVHRACSLKRGQVVSRRQSCLVGSPGA
jgi:hypothetical protein